MEYSVNVIHRIHILQILRWLTEELLRTRRSQYALSVSMVSKKRREVPKRAAGLNNIRVYTGTNESGVVLS